MAGVDLFEGQWGRKPRPAARVSGCGCLPLLALVPGNRQSECGSFCFLYSLLLVFSSRCGEGSRTLVSPQSPPWSFCYPLLCLPPALEGKCDLAGDSRGYPFWPRALMAVIVAVLDSPDPKDGCEAGLEDLTMGV